MKSICITITLSLLFFYSGAQGIKDKNLQTLVETEYAFAAMAKEENTRDAFMRYLSDHTIMIINAEISKGKKIWQDRKPDSSLLIWKPMVADISASGDFGYTTGPSEYYPSRRQGEQVFYGSYITIWKKDAAMDWKMLLDIGVYPQPKPLLNSLKIPTLSETPKAKIRNSRLELLDYEKKFRTSLSDTSEKTYNSLVSTEARFLRVGLEPSTTKEKIKEIMQKEIDKASYSLIDGATSYAGDLGYVYGKVILTEKEKQTNGFFIRIYKKENNKDWKVVLDAIHQ